MSAVSRDRVASFLREHHEMTLATQGAAGPWAAAVFYAHEGLDLLLQAFPVILKAAPDVRLLLVGGGPQNDSLKQLAAELGIQDKVIFTGRVPHDQVLWLSGRSPSQLAPLSARPCRRRARKTNSWSGHAIA